MARADSTAALIERIQLQADYCRSAASGLTAAILDGAAADLARGGPTTAVLAPVADDPAGSVPALRFTGALHRLVLERRAPGLAVHYPTVGGTPGDVWPAALAVVEEQTEVLQELVQHPVQTNEVGRSSALLGGLVAVQRRTRLPIRLLELGASAGLNLLFDRYAHEVAQDVVLGDPVSPVRLHRPWQGRHPAYEDVHVVERVGCDPRPLDPTSTADRLTLTSYVWGDHVHRFERLRGALQIAAADRPTVQPRGAAEFLERELARPREGVVTVVWHSVVRQYLDAGERRVVDDLLARAGERATADAPLAHLSVEPGRGDGAQFRVALRRWPGGRPRLLGTCDGHGPPVVWR